VVRRSAVLVALSGAAFLKLKELLRVVERSEGVERATALLSVSESYPRAMRLYI
jgi:hypothetical protein